MPSPICFRLRLVVRQPVLSGPLQVRPWSLLRYSQASLSGPLAGSKVQFHGRPRCAYQRSAGPEMDSVLFQSTASSSVPSSSLMIERPMK